MDNSECYGTITNTLGEILVKKQQEEMQLNKLKELTNFTEEECEHLFQKTGWDKDTAFNNMQGYLSGTSGAIASREAIECGIKNAGLYEKLGKNLSNYNTMRGGAKGFKGFVFEELHATDATIKGVHTEVINNNGIADFIIKNPDGTVKYAQAKMGYNTANVDFSVYKGQTIIVDKGNEALIKKAREAGVEVIESDIGKNQATKLAESMQLESKITGNKNAVVVPKANAALNIANEAHMAGMKVAAKSGQFGGGFSLGSNIVDVMAGDKEVDEAVIGIAKDTIVSTGIGYATGAIATAVGNTAVGIAVTEGVAAAGTMLAGTAVGSAAVAAGTAVVGTAAAAGTAIAGTAAAAGTAIAGTAVGTAAVAAGTAVAGTAAAAGTAIAGTAVGTAAVAAGTAIAGTAIGAAAIAAAPIVIGAAAIGAGVNIVKRIFGR